MELRRFALGVLVVAVTAGGFGPDAQAESCIDYPAAPNPPTLGALDTPGWATTVAVRNGVACIATVGAGFRIADVTDLHSPVEIAALDTYANASGVDLEEGKAYLADGSAGVAVLDLASPSTPVELARFDTPGEAHAVDAVGSMAYVADQAGGLRILDVTNPTAPVELGSFDTPGSAFDVLVEGTYAYVADAGSGLTVVNATDPTHPTLVANVPMPGTAFALAREAGFTYVAAGTGGVVVVRSGTNAIVRTLVIPEFVYDVAIEGKRLYVANGYGGVRIYNITAGASPIFVGIANQPFQATGLGLADGSIFVADGEPGLRIIPQQCQSTLVDSPLGDFVGALSVTNPARGTAHVRLRLRETNRIQLQLFDVAGRQVRTLITGSLTPGDHRFEWNGRDDRGSRVSNGVYLARVVSDHDATQTWFVYLR